MRFWLLLLLLSLHTGPAQANVGPPWTRGDALGDPAAGPLAAWSVVHEELAVDLTGLATGNSAQVTVQYHLRNDGPERTETLDFVAPDMGSVTVYLDGMPLLSERPDEAEVPPAWQPPAHSPPLDEGGEPIPIQYESWAEGKPGHVLVERFAATLSPGTHLLEVVYHTVPATANAGDHPYRVYQFAYVLSPARQWASFGRLDVSVQVPPDWDVVAAPPLQRAAGTLSGRFDGLPGDSLTLSLRPSVEPWRVSVAETLPLAGLALALLLGIGFGLALTAHLAKREAGRLRTFLTLFLGGPWLGFAAGLLAVWVASFGTSFLAAEHLANQFSYRHSMFAYLLLGPAAGSITFLTIVLTVLLARRRWRERP